MELKSTHRENHANEPTRGRSCEEAVREATHNGILAVPRSTVPNGLLWLGLWRCGAAHIVYQA